VDSLDPRVLGHFLELIHERYRAGLDPAAFDYIEAIFFDEPESGMIKDPFPETAGIPWSRIMPEKLRAAFGADYLRPNSRCSSPAATAMRKSAPGSGSSSPTR
jgi:hypothetical protein